MSLFMLYGETNLGISLDITSYLNATGLDIADRTDVIFMLKSNRPDVDLDAEYSINESADLVVSGNIITAKINDWSLLLPDVTYYIGFGILMTAESTFREMPLIATKREIKFRQDVIRQ